MHLANQSGHTASQPLPEMNLERDAFFLDVDGTLIDIAATPEKVHVPVPLKADLARLLTASKGAMALVSGRSVAALDRLFAPLELPCVGVHGGEVRMLPPRNVEHMMPAPLPVTLREELLRIAQGGHGLVFEDKGQSFAIHFRQANVMAETLRQDIEHCLARAGAAQMELLHGKSVFEIKPRDFSKGLAVEKLMQREPFTGRRPVFIGDDTTDESAFASVTRLGGISISVSRSFRHAPFQFAAPADVRAWLAQLVGEQKT